MAKSRKTNGFIPEEHFSESKHRVNILTLEDIKQEYALVLGQLKLSSVMPDLYENRGPSTCVDSPLTL